MMTPMDGMPRDARYRLALVGVYAYANQIVNPEGTATVVLDGAGTRAGCGSSEAALE